MATKTDTIPPRHFVRRCMACGYDGPAIRAIHTANCALCGCDLNARPPRSYAEMEGFVDLRPARELPVVAEAEHRSRLLARWLAFVFFVICVVGSLTYLTMAAFAI